MAIEVLIVGGLAAALALALFNAAPRAASGIVFARRIGIGIIALLGALFLISTNQLGAMIVGGIVIFLITLAYAVDKNGAGAEVW